MKWVLGLLALCVFLLGSESLSQAESAMHETTAAVFFCTSGILFVGAAIVEKLQSIRQALDYEEEDDEKQKN